MVWPDDSFAKFVDQLPLISTHEHHREDAFQRSLDLDRLFENSYVGWGPHVEGMSGEARRKWLERVRHKSYFVWLERAVGAIYEVDRITEENWDELSGRIRRAHQDSGHHIRILREHARFQRFLQDSYWEPGSDVGHPEIATPVYRIDTWLASFHPEAADHDGVNAGRHVGRKLASLDEYEEALRDEIRRRRPKVAAIKCAAAYERPIDFGPASREEAKAIFNRHPSEVTAGERKVFSDYIFQVVLELAGELDLPVQVHTGLGQLGGSNPLLLEPVIAAHPKVRFVLFHGGYPWVHEIGALAHNHANVLIDLCWLPLISTSAAVVALSEYIDVAPDIGILAWGGDCWTSEESLGAAGALRYILKSALGQKMDAGLIRPRDAESIAEAIAHRNARRIYGL